MSKTDKLLSSQSWQASVRVVEDFLKTESKLDALLEARIRNLSGDICRRVQYLSYGVVRNLGRLQSLLKLAVKKAPKKRLQAIMLVSLFEWLEASEEDRPLVVHHAVGMAQKLLSKPEGKFANAVLRKMPELVAGEKRSSDSLDFLTSHYSHPRWLLERWKDLWGGEDAEAFLKWNQSTPGIYAFCPGSDRTVPENWKTTPWPCFFAIEDADWQETRKYLAEGKAYIQDPSTRLGSKLLEGEAVTSVLDLCAAPGGKSIQLLNRLSGSEGLLVSVDVPGSRFERLKENLARYQMPGVTLVQVAEDVLGLNGDHLPRPDFDAVYVDVPCSNTGVIQRRPDVKWRLTERQIRGLVELQLALLRKAAQFVKVGGILIYSTCSVDPDENQGVVSRFLEKAGETWVLEKEVISLPWKTGHDGAGVFLLRKLR